MNNSYINKNRFTMLEMLVVMAIIVLLAAILFPTVNVITQRIKDMRALSRAKTLKQAIDTYITTYNRSPFYKFTPSTSYSSLTYDSVCANLGKSNLGAVGNPSTWFYDFVIPYPDKQSVQATFNSKSKEGLPTWYDDKYGQKDCWAGEHNGSIVTKVTYSMPDDEYYDRLIRILAAAADKDLMKKYNPKKIVFLNGMDSEGHFLDPWGKRMGIAIDKSGDGQVNPYPVYIPSSDHSTNWREGKNVLQKVLVWSFGANSINECGFNSSDGINPVTNQKFDDINTWKE